MSNQTEPETNQAAAKSAAEILAYFQGETMKAMRQQAEEIKTVGEAATRTKDEVQGTRKALLDMQAKVYEMEAASRRIGVGERFNSSPGDLVISSDAYKSYVAASCRGTMPAILLPSDVSFNQKATPLTQLDAIGTETTGTGLLPAYLGGSSFMPAWAGQPGRQPRVRSIFNVAPCTQAAVQFIMETGYLSDPVGQQYHADTDPTILAPTAHALTRSPGANATEGTLTYTQFSRPIESISAFIQATRESVSDALQLRSQINMQLMSALGDAEDFQLLYGNGTAPNLLGLTTTPYIQTYSQSSGAADDNMADAVLMAITQVNLAKYPCTGIIMNPLDWAKIKKMKAGADGMYVGPSMFAVGPSSLWEVPVVVTPAITAGTFICGATQMGATIWDRQQATVFISDSHDTNFIKQVITVLADERIALTVTRPEAFVLGSWDVS